MYIPNNDQEIIITKKPQGQYQEQMTFTLSVKQFDLVQQAIAADLKAKIVILDDAGKKKYTIPRTKLKNLLYQFKTSRDGNPFMLVYFHKAVKK